MDLTTAILNPDSSKWRTFLREAGGSVFQGPDMARFLAGVGRRRPLALGLEIDGRLAGTLLADIIWEPGIKGPFSGRSVITGGPVIAPWVPSRESIVRVLLDAYEEALPRNVIYTEVRNLEDRSQDRSGFQARKFNYEGHANFLVDLRTAPDTLLSRLQTSKRRQVRKALKDGAEIIDEPGEEDIRDLYAILKELYRERVRKPLAPLEFFTRLGTLNDNELCLRLFVVKWRGRVVGGIVCPTTRRETIYEWYVCGARDAGVVFPSVLATWAPMEWGCRNGFHTFDFMGAGKQGEAYGVRDFKEGFGGRLVDYGRFRKVHRPALMAIGRIAIAAIRKIPR